MGSMDIEWQEVDVSVEGLNQHIDPLVMPPGQFVSLVNGEFTKTGSVRKRPGILPIINGPTSFMPAADKLSRHKNELLCYDSQGLSIIEPAIWSLHEADTGWRFRVVAPTATIRKRAVAGDLNQQMLADVGVTNTYIIQAVSFLNRATSAGWDSTGYGSCYVRIRELKNNSLVLEDRLDEGYQCPRVAVTGSGRFALVAWSDFNSTTIYGAVYDLSSGVSQLTAPTAIVTDQSVECQFDVVGMSGDQFALVYRTGDGPGTDSVRAIRLDTALTIGASQTFGNDPTAMSALEEDSLIWVNWHNWDGEAGRWTRTALNPSTWGITHVPLVWAVSQTDEGLSSGISSAAQAGGGVCLFGSDLWTSSATQDPVRTTWRTCDAAGALGTQQIKLDVKLISRPWRIDNRHYLWVRGGVSITVPVDPARPDRPYFALLKVDETTSKTFLEAVTATDTASPQYIDDQPGYGGFTAPASSYTDGRYYYSMLHALKFDDFNVLPSEYRTDFSHPGRMKAVQFGGLSYFSGGVVTYWDGHRLSEAGFVPPSLKANVTASGGGLSTWSGTGDRRYLVLYEITDSEGNRHYSGLSNIETATIASTTNSVVELNISTPATRRFFKETYTEDTPRIAVTVYVELPLNSNVFQRVTSFDLTDQYSPAVVDPEATADQILWTVDTDFTTGFEALYSPITLDGEVENILPDGGATTLAVHKDRLWLGGGEDPEILWYSKPRIDGRPAEFSREFQLRIPDEEVVSLESLDDNLLIFCVRGIYYVGGSDGPDAAGLGAPLPLPSKLNSAVGCINPRSTITTPVGVFFRSKQGIEMVDRGLNVIYIGEPISSTLASYPTVKGAIVVQERSQVRFSLANTAGTDGVVAVFDYSENKWSVWDYATGGDPWVDMAVWTDHTGTWRSPVFLNDTGSLFVERDTLYADTDTAGTAHWYGVTAEFGWFSFGRQSGYKKVRKTHPLLERLGNFGLDVQIAFAKDSSNTATLSWTEAQITALTGAKNLRIFIPSPMQTSPAIKVKLIETTQNPNTAAQGFSLYGLSFEVGQIPGLQRLPAANTR